MSQKDQTPTIFWNNFTKTDQLSMTFNGEDRYSFAYCLWLKSLVWVENHLCSFHRNSSIIAG